MTRRNRSLLWLIRHDPEAALAVFLRLRAQYQNMGSSCDDQIEEFHSEALHEVIPGMNQLLRLAGGIAWPWSGTRYNRDGKTRWYGEPYRYEFPLTQELLGDDLIRLGRLTYFVRPGALHPPETGMLASYIDDHGTERRPKFSANKPRGGRRVRRPSAAGYLALTPAIASPLRAEPYMRPFSGERVIGDMYDPLPRIEPDAHDRIGRYGVQEARTLLKRLGVDGCVHFDQLPITGQLCPTVAARGAQFLGGMSGRCQTASFAARNWDEPAAVPLSPVLEVVAERGSLKDIGTRLGYRGGYSDRAGKKALLAAGRELIGANENISRNAAA